MVTVESPSHPLTFFGLSTDTKPVRTWGNLKIRNGEAFLEMDTGDIYFYNKANDSWVAPE